MFLLASKVVIGFVAAELLEVFPLLVECFVPIADLLECGGITLID